jgi:hypothetical protein
VILGALKQGRSYGNLDVLLSASAFTEDFPRTLAIFLHEHAHVYGYDGSRAFTNVLTGLVESIARHRKALESYDNGWQEARKAIIKERGPSRTASDETTAEQLRSLDREALHCLIDRLPAAVARLILRSGQQKTDEDEPKSLGPRTLEGNRS